MGAWGQGWRTPATHTHTTPQHQAGPLACTSCTNEVTGSAKATCTEVGVDTNSCRLCHRPVVRVSSEDRIPQMWKSACQRHPFTASTPSCRPSPFHSWHSAASPNQSELTAHSSTAHHSFPAAPPATLSATDSDAKRSKAGRVRHSSMLCSYASATWVHSGSQLRPERGCKFHCCWRLSQYLWRSKRQSRHSATTGRC